MYYSRQVVSPKYRIRRCKQMWGVSACGHPMMKRNLVTERSTIASVALTGVEVTGVELVTGTMLPPSVDRKAAQIEYLVEEAEEMKPRRLMSPQIP